MQQGEYPRENQIKSNQIRSDQIVRIHRIAEPVLAPAS